MRRMLFLVLMLTALASTVAMALPPNILLEHEDDTKFFFAPDAQTYVRSFYIRTDAGDPWTGLTPTLYFRDLTENGNRTAHFCDESGTYSPSFTATEDGGGWYTFEFELGAGVIYTQPTTRIVMHVDANATEWQEFTLYEASPDLNGDLVVNLSDTSIYASILYGTFDSRADFNHDGVLNLSDTGFMARHIGDSCP